MAVEMTDEKKKALDVAINQIERQHGKGAIMRLGAEGARVKTEAISTGALNLDHAVGIGGVPRGRVTEIYGPESSGKTTLTLHVIANAQKGGGVAAFIDAEHALDVQYAEKLGVDTENLLVSQPDTGEQALEIAEVLVRSGALDVVVVDSVAALVPRAEIEGEMGDAHVGLQARLMSQAMRKLTGAIGRSRTALIFTNQIREKIGVMFGNPETTSGGRALKFYASLRLDIRRIASIKEGNEQVGNRTRVKVVKNKCLAAGTKVFDPTMGEVRRIEEIAATDDPVEVVGVDKRGRLGARHVLRRFDQGEAEVTGLRLRDGTELWVTPDHEVMTDDGWRQAGHLDVGDRVARPRRAFGFGDEEPVTPAAARLLGYLIGDGYVGGKTPVTFVNTSEALRDDVTRIAADLGCVSELRGRGYELALSHRPGEKNGVLELCRWAGIHGCLAWEKRIPAAFFSENTSAWVVANLVQGIWESDGHLSRERTGGLRIGFTTTSEQLAHQLHWILLRWEIGSSVREYDTSQKRPGLVDGRRIQHRRPCWEVRVSGIENVTRFAEAIPTWGPKGRVLEERLSDPALATHRGSQRAYLPANQAEPVLEWLRDQDVSPALAATLAGAPDPTGGLRQVIGTSRPRRDRVQALADGLQSEFLAGVLEGQLWYDRIVEVLPSRRAHVYDVEVPADHSFVASDVVVSNCAPPFKQAEFDIMFNEGISNEGLLIDLGEEAGVVDRAGAWYSYGEDVRLGQGRENSKQFLKENPDIAAEIETKIKDELGLRKPDAASGEDEEVEAAEED
ncbi:MAG: intein-containing recombinase RecA [Candidatus Palauibacterales bacterium]|nr:intein-containing recombinase RecA [Candidatus Palauibacterales bacterium]MDP2582591.1 intein-containing recombinase RecA [Candidatus Palauibacterales bacterium]